MPRDEMKSNWEEGDKRDRSKTKELNIYGYPEIYIPTIRSIKVNDHGLIVGCMYYRVDIEIKVEIHSNVHLAG